MTNYPNIDEIRRHMAETQPNVYTLETDWSIMRRTSFPNGDTLTMIKESYWGKRILIENRGTVLNTWEMRPDAIII